MLALADADFSDKFDIAPPTNTNTNAIPPLVPAINAHARTRGSPFIHSSAEAPSIALSSPISPRTDITPISFDPTLGESLAPPPLFPLGAFAGFNGGVFLSNVPASAPPPAAPTLHAPSVVESPSTMTTKSEPEPLTQAPAAAMSGEAGVGFMTTEFHAEEDSGALVFWVGGYRGSTEAMFDYTVTAGTASDVEDFVPVSGTLVVNRSNYPYMVDGLWQAPIVVPLIPDQFPEPNETVHVTLSNPVNATFVWSATATGYIDNDDTGIKLTAATTNVPVNANRTNGSPWRRDAANNELIGLPTIRDFDLSHMRDLSTWNGMGAPPAGPAIVDPELKKMTATVEGGAATGAIKVDVIYANSFTGGRVRLWSDQSKTTELAPGTFIPFGGVVGGSGNLPNYPTSDFYVEGTRPSRAVDDITIRVTYIQGDKIFTNEKKLTVTPVIDELSLVNPKTPPTATFVRNDNGAIIGISSGEQANGADPGTTKPGVTYAADVNVKGIAGDPMFLQNVTALTHGAPALVLTNGIRYNPSFGTTTFPIIDTFDADPVPYYRNSHGHVYNDDRKTIQSADTPAFGHSTFAGLIQSMDLTFNARMYVVWRFPDATMYTLALQDWQVGFQAITVPVFEIGLQLLPTSIVSASPKVITNADPAKIVGPNTFNSFVRQGINGFWTPI